MFQNFVDVIWMYINYFLQIFLECMLWMYFNYSSFFSEFLWLYLNFSRIYKIRY